MSAIAQAAEFHDIRLKSGEKSLYKHINKDVGIKFPIKVDIALSAHKVSLLLQAELGGVDFPVSEQFAKHKNQFQQDKTMVFQHVNRLVRCVTDCQLTRGDARAARHALELARSFAARVWDNSPLQLKQLDQVGNVAVRKLANAGINSIESLENTEAHRIETVIGRGPPFGMKMLSQLAQFPKLRVLVKMAGKEMIPQGYVKIKFKAEIGFLNETVPAFFRRKPVYVCFLAETSDGHIIDFRRIAASKLQNGHELILSTELSKPSQYILCHVMCDEIAGTCRSAEMRPPIVPASWFPTFTEQKEGYKKDEVTNKVLSSERPQDANRKRKRSEDFNDSGLDDGDLLAAESVEVMDLDAFDDQLASLPSIADQPNKKMNQSPKRYRTDDDSGEPVQMENGKWACNHKCKDKTRCKHLCCKEGLDKPPKPSRKPSSSTAENRLSVASMLGAVNDDPLEHTPSILTKRHIELNKSSAHGVQTQRDTIPGAKESGRLMKLHRLTTPRVPNRGPPAAASPLNTKKKYGQQGSAAVDASSITSVDDDPFNSDGACGVSLDDPEDIANSNNVFRQQHGIPRAVAADKYSTSDDTWPELDNDDFNFDDNDAPMLEASMIGLDDSMQLQGDSHNRQNKNDHSDLYSPLSSGTVHESSPSKIERLQRDNIFDSDDAIYDFDQEDWDSRDPVMSCPSDTGAAGRAHNTSSNNEGVTSSSKKLFFTSPERAQVALTHGSAEDTASQQSDADISTPTIRVHATVEEIPDATTVDSVSDKLREEAQVGEINDDNSTVEGKKTEDGQNLLMDDGIDPSFYDEFKDIVEFI